MDSFPNATELYLRAGFFTLCPSLGIVLGRIVPLKQLTKLVVQCHRFPFIKLLDLLCFTPHIHTLIFQSMSLYGHNYRSVEQSESFQRVSTTNTITHVTCKNRCTLEKVKLLIALCPRVQHLAINTLVKTLKPITRFLLDKSNQNTCHLCLLCFTRVSGTWFELLDKLVKSEKLLDDHNLKSIDSGLYLWW
jgi:hypothetical protein